MVLELHIWGPAFGLPSIDAPCLAAIALFRKCLEHEEWVLIPSSDPSTIPSGELPALKDGDIWIAGYRSIITYLRDASDGKWDINSSLNPQQLADCTAYLAFIESRGGPLLDLLLYVSSENYNSATKPALGDLLSWPSSWVLPGKLRAAAKRRSEHLGLSGLDIDTIGDDKNTDGGLSAQIPASLRRPRLTVISMLGRDMRKNRFRLDAVNSAFLDPLEEALGEKQWLFGDTPSTADCLAVSALALMYMTAGVPNPWLRSTLNTKHPKLASWIEKQSTALFGNTSPSGSTVRGQRNIWVDLPWRQPAARSWEDVANAVIQTTTEATTLGSCFAVRESNPPTTDNYTKAQHQKSSSLTRLHENQLLYSQVLMASLSLTTLVGVLVWKGILGFARRNPTPGFRNFGEAGNMLGLG